MPTEVRIDRIEELVLRVLQMLPHRLVICPRRLAMELEHDQSMLLRE